MIPRKAILLKSGADFISYPEIAGTCVTVHYISSENEALIEIPFPGEQRTYTPFARLQDLYILE